MIILKERGIKVSYEIKEREREREEEGAVRKRRKMHNFLQKPEIMHYSFLLISFSIDMEDYTLFLGCKDTQTFRFQEL